MTFNRNVLVWIIVAVAIAGYFVIQPESTTDQLEAENTLPDDNPDIFITGLDLTRFGPSGDIILKTLADTMAVYDERGESILTEPKVSLIENGEASWIISSQKATVFSNDDIEFTSDVVATNNQLQPPLVVETQYMKVTQKGELISTDVAVQIVQGKQTMSAVGMQVKLDTIEPVIQLLSDVSFQYDPS